MRDKMSPLKKNQKLFYIRQKQNIRHFFNPAQERTLPFSILLLFHTTCSKTKTKKQKKPTTTTKKLRKDTPETFRKINYRCGKRKEDTDTRVCTHTLELIKTAVSFLVQTTNFTGKQL